MEEGRSVAQAIDALRRGWPVRIDDDSGTITLLAIETADDRRLRAFDPRGAADVLLSGGRAATLKLANQVGAADPVQPVLIERTSWLDLAAAHALADPTLDLATPLKGPFRSKACPALRSAKAALELARLAGLLPAFFAHAGDDEEAVQVIAGQIERYEAPQRLRIVARARLPVDAAERAEIVAFRNADDASEHVALIVGTPDGQPPLVRLHSECLTGDVLGSLKCDCGPQLHAALREIAASEWGILLYLRQEGRGIGLINKLRAYALQDQGFDTVDANVRLGFAIDARDFGIASRMLSLLGQDTVRLLTNNPAKVAGLEAAGTKVVERVAHAVPSNPHNEAYLATKRDRTGHQL
jgi:GTP cyclohydrolase II